MFLKDQPFIVYRICQEIVLHLPLKFSYKLASAISNVYRWLHKRDYFTIQKNLRIIFPDKSEREIIKYARETFRNFAMHLVDFLYFPKLNREYIKKNIKIEGVENFDSALLKKQGIVGITAHLGSWEIGGAIAALLGYPVNAIALEHSNRKVQDFFLRQREEKGIKVIFPRDVARKTLAALGRKEIVSFLNDKDYFGSGLELSFFGRKTLIPRGAAVFALKTKSLVVPGFTVREAGWLKFVVEEPLSYKPSGNEKKDIKEITQKIIAIIEKYIRRYPGQWYYFDEL
ncbi:MAG: hypothetical protein B5M48_02390 [Candidatus Omnitrophica bacterium 4484_213]|nr:MAG: hypothetical protein B5M48_02390 [Candidatus Omnitrophica bacterium 4484_213]